MTPSIPRRIYDFSLKQWVLSSFVLTLSTLWFASLNLFGKSWGIYDAKGDLEPVISTITWCVVAISVTFALLKTRADKYNEEAKNNGQYVLERLLESMDSVTTKKMNRFCEYIKNSKDSDKVNPFEDITQPKMQIISILENVQITLSDIFGIPRSDIGISIIYKHDENDEWQWLCEMDNTGDLSLSEILTNQNSSARQVIDKKGSLLFYPDKRVGQRNNKYVFAPKDEQYDKIGSILSKDISIGNDSNYRAILNISTYGKQFCEEKDADTTLKIKNYILPSFIKRIQLELALLHIKHLHIKHLHNKANKKIQRTV